MNEARRRHWSIMLGLWALTTTGAIRAELPGTGAVYEATPDNEYLGKLFFSPIERTALDLVRRDPSAALPTSDAEASDATAVEVLVNGIVGNRIGARAVWLNGAQQTKDQPGTGPRALFDAVAPPAVPILMPGREEVVELKVGEHYDANTGERTSYRSAELAADALPVDSQPETVVQGTSQTDPAPTSGMPD